MAYPYRERNAPLFTPRSPLNPAARDFVPKVAMNIDMPLGSPTNCWDWANDVASASPKGEGAPKSIHSVAENVRSLSKEGIHSNSDISVAKGLEQADNTANDEAKIAAMKDAIVREYLKVLKLVPDQIDKTLQVIVYTCNDILSFKSIVEQSRLGVDLDADYAEAVHKIQDIAQKHKSLSRTLTRLRIGTEVRLYKAGLGHLLVPEETKEELPHKASVKAEEPSENLEMMIGGVLDCEKTEKVEELREFLDSVQEK